MGSLEDKVKWSRELSKSVAPLDFYREHYQGLTRGELHNQDKSLYERLRRDGLLEQVPTKSRFGNDPVAYYQEHYPGLTRGELQKQDHSLYQTLWKDGLLEHVPTKKVDSAMTHLPIIKSITPA